MRSTHYCHYCNNKVKKTLEKSIKCENAAIAKAISLMYF